ncbi:arginase family protein [Microbacterium proteolyticum]|uniref:arginase family protein n=1 Tax=Microbacterium proteolyticum TaxID=1572644 RepID=UPI0035A8A27C|nr:arginase family protein [Microbacterium proteolyticum]
MKVTVLGVPSSAGAYCVGVERAPAALREAGLVEALRAAGAEAVDRGDLTMRRWAPDRESPFAQNVGDEAEAIRELSAAAAGLLAEGERLLVLGGSCMVAVGLCAAMAERGERPRLIYIDRHLDLNTPNSTTEGSLSWMGMAHALALDGAASELVQATGRWPLLQPPDLVYLGADPTRDDPVGTRAGRRPRSRDRRSGGTLQRPSRRGATSARDPLPRPVRRASGRRRPRLPRRAHRRERERTQQRTHHRPPRAPPSSSSSAIPTAAECRSGSSTQPTPPQTPVRYRGSSQPSSLH